MTVNIECGEMIKEINNMAWSEFKESLNASFNYEDVWVLFELDVNMKLGFDDMVEALNQLNSVMGNIEDYGVMGYNVARDLKEFLEYGIDNKTSLGVW